MRAHPVDADVASARDGVIGTGKTVGHRHAPRSIAVLTRRTRRRVADTFRGAVARRRATSAGGRTARRRRSAGASAAVARHRRMSAGATHAHIPRAAITVIGTRGVIRERDASRTVPPLAIGTLRAMSHLAEEARRAGSTHRSARVTPRRRATTVARVAVIRDVLGVIACPRQADVARAHVAIVTARRSIRSRNAVIARERLARPASHTVTHHAGAARTIRSTRVAT